MLLGIQAHQRRRAKCEGMGVRGQFRHRYGKMDQRLTYDQEGQGRRGWRWGIKLGKVASPYMGGFEHIPVLVAIQFLKGFLHLVYQGYVKFG